jgi:hypothetical protein
MRVAVGRQPGEISRGRHKTDLEIFKGRVLMPCMVAHVCNPSYSGGRDPDESSSSSAQQKVLE